MKIKKLFWFLFVFIFFICCSQKKEKVLTEQEIQNTKEALIGANRMLIKKDREKIIEYNKEHQLSLIETESGLWYDLLKQGNGEPVKMNMLITIDYQVSLLDGTICYDSDSLGIKQFRVGKGGVESGLEEGVLLMNKGSKAIFVMPPHLAHGLTGDGDRIPARSVIVYRIDILNVEP